MRKAPQLAKKSEEAPKAAKAPVQIVDEDEFKYLAFNNSKLFVANQKCIKVVLIK